MSYNGPVDPEEHEHKPSAPLPPHDLEAEAVVVCECMISDEKFALVAPLLEPRHFFAEAHRRMFEAVLALTKAGQHVDVTAVAGWLRDHGRSAQVGGAKALAELIEHTPSSSRIEDHAKRVLAFARLRDLISATRQISAEGYAVTGFDVQTFLDSAERKVYELAREHGSRKGQRMLDVLRDAHAHLVAAESRQGAVEISTGLTKLDHHIGGLGRGRVTVIAARPGMGKTALATGIVENVAGAGGNAAIFSMEMPAWQLGMRMACTRASVSVLQAMNGWLSDTNRTLFLRALDDLRDLPIVIDDTPGLTLLQLRSKARLAAAELGPLSLIVVDYLQLMTGGDDGRKNRDREISEITAGMKTLAKEMSCSVILLSQLNRDCEQEKDKRPRLSNLRDSGGIEQDADDVIFVYRDDYYHANSDDQGVAELIVAKQRNGPTGPVRVAFDGPSTAFLNLSEH